MRIRFSQLPFFYRWQPGCWPSAGSPARRSNRAPYRLTLQDAIQKALQANLNVLVAGTRVEEAEGARMRSLSAALLPRVNAQTYANAQNRDLRAFGISLPGIPIPKVVGPFSNYDFRVYAQQNIVDLQSYRGLKASERALDAGKMDEQDARDLIVRVNCRPLSERAVGRGARRCRAIARDRLQHAATSWPKTSTMPGRQRAWTCCARRCSLPTISRRCSMAQNQFKQSLLALARNLGMSPGTPLELAEPLNYRPLSQPEPETLVPAALLARADYLSLASQRQELGGAAARQPRPLLSQAEHQRQLSASIGRSIGGVQATGLIQGQIDFTVFDRDREGEAQQLAGRVKRIDDQIADLRRGIEEDIREALLNLDSAAEQVRVAEEGQNLAQRELELAQDRFQSGTANNVEVVTAQDELARAEENYILAVSSHVDAKFALARAHGRYGEEHSCSSRGIHRPAG